MGVSLEVVRWLRNEGHDAVHLREESPGRLTDPKIFAKALAEDRVIPTFDLDFGEIATLSRGTLAKVALAWPFLSRSFPIGLLHLPPSPGGRGSG